MQAPAETIAKYKGRYDAGYEALRDARLARQKQLGLVPVDLKPHDWEGVKPWASLSADEKAIEARKMEVYAAMVDRMDQNVGRSEEHTSELQSLMRISYAVFCLKKKKNNTNKITHTTQK